MTRAGSDPEPKVTLDELTPHPRRDAKAIRPTPPGPNPSGQAPGGPRPRQDLAGKAAPPGAVGHATAGVEPRFSPDPAAPTDRYRLVTPFSLRF